MLLYKPWQKVVIMGNASAENLPEGEKDAILTGQIGRTRIYRQLALATLVFILLILSFPGHWIAALQSWFQLWWPWVAPEQVPSNFPIDKLIHTALFAICAAFFVRGWHILRERWWSVCVVLILFAALTELIQRYVPGRSATLGDLLADGVGVILGVGMALLYLRKRPHA